ncbi:MAG: hypothetical protein K2H64_07780, partial [Desulfovibrio sp.]|nr:hypothetical protein [Desulfovibrio sp.]
MKKFWLAFAGGVAVAIIAAAIFLYGFAGKYISGVISRACLAAYGSTPEFSGVPSLSLFPLGLDTGPFRWSLNASGFATDIEAKGLKARAELLPLFSGEIRFSEILIDSPAIALKRTKGNALVAGARDSVDGKSFSVYIARLAIRNGSTNIDDALRVSDARLVATNIDPKKGGDLKGDFALTTTLGGQKIRGNLAFTGNARFYSPNLTLRQTSVTFTAGNDSALAVFSPLKLNFDGAVNLEKNSLRATEALLSSPQGSVRLRGESGQDFNSFDGDIRVAADLAKIDKYFGLGLPGMETDISSPVAYRYPEIA